MVEKFRKDTDFMAEFFYGNTISINAPTSVIISKTDIFTKNYSDAEPLWKSVARNFETVLFVNTDSHYFQTDESETVAQFITNTIE